ncbi:unnamed protein product, partial [Prorocentrum cordatum]
ANKHLDQYDHVAGFIEDVAPESQVFASQIAEDFDQNLDNLEGHGAPQSCVSRDVMMTSGYHLMARTGQEEVWHQMGSSPPILTATKPKPPKQICSAKLKDTMHQRMLTFMSDVAITQAINGRYCYCERDSNSRDWEGQLVRKLERLPEVQSGVAYQRKRRYRSNLPGNALEFGKMLVQECLNYHLQGLLGERPEPLLELAGAQIKPIIKDKASINTSEELTGGTAPCCAAPTRIAKDERSTDPHIKQQVQYIHENMGHCSNENSVMVLKCGKARQVYIDAVQKLVCPSCDANKRPRLEKLSNAPATNQFNDVIGMDIFFVLGPERTAKVPMLKVACHGTGDFCELVDSINVAIGDSFRSGGSRALNGVAELARSTDMRKAAMAAYIEAGCSEKWRNHLRNLSYHEQRHQNLQEIEKSIENNPDVTPMKSQRYDHLDDVSITIKQKKDFPSSAMLASERIATFEEAKGAAVRSALLTSTNQRMRKDITGKYLLNTYNYQPYLAAERREWNDIKNADAVKVMPPVQAANIRRDPELASRIMGSRWALADKGGYPEVAGASKRQLLFLTDGAWRMAKARWTVQCHAGPDLSGLEIYSPVVGKDSVFLILQIWCTSKWALQLDYLAWRGSLVKLLKAVRGLGDAPVQSLTALTNYAKDVGFKCSIFDGCVFTFATIKDYMEWWDMRRKK